MTSPRAPKGPEERRGRKRPDLYRVDVGFLVWLEDPETQDARDAVAAVRKWLATAPDFFKVRPVSARERKELANAD